MSKKTNKPSPSPQGNTRGAYKQTHKPTWKEARMKKKAALKKKRSQYHWSKRALYATGRGVRYVSLVGLLTASAGTVGGVIYYQKHLEPLVSENIREGYELAQTIDASHFKAVPPTVMKDGNGEVLRTFKDRNFLHLDLQADDVLYERVSNVVTTIEDERFYQHKGFDYLGVGVAVFDYVARGKDLRGASTLTQQLVKNAFLSQEQSLDRKVTEAVMAQELEKKFSKREILEFYLNDIYFGNGNYGMETAAQYYFSQPTSELTEGQLATLIAIPNNPTIYDPLTNPENNMSRRNLVLSLMAHKGHLEPEVATAEKEKELGLHVTDNGIDNTVSDWAESYALHATVEELMRAEGFQFQYWQDSYTEQQDYIADYNAVYHRVRENILRGGFVIETSIDKDMQALLQNQVDTHTSGYYEVGENGLYAKQTPATVIDNQTNEVVAIVGGRSQENPGSFNRAFQATRQPGSAIKPFLSYATAIENGLATETTRKDAPIENGPQNWYLSYKGDVTLRYAMAQSINTVPYNLYQEFGMETARQKLIDMEFGGFTPDDIYPTLSIGGWTHGTNPLEMAAAFNTLTNDGLYYRPTNVRRILHTLQEEPVFDRATIEPKRIYESGVGYVTLDMMKSVIRTGIGSGYSFGYKHEAAKTGSTDDYVEQWIVGGTPYYAIAIYIGDDTPSPQYNIETNGTLQDIFKGFLSETHRGKEVIDFKRPATVVEQDGNLWIRERQEANPHAERKEAEAKRVAALEDKQKNRVATLAYRIKHGLTLVQTEAREQVASKRIGTLEGYSLKGSKDLTEAQKLRDLAAKSLEDVVRTDVKETLTERLYEAYAAIEYERQVTIDAELEAERLEQERLAFEQAEKERLEQERLDEIARVKAEEEARIQAEKDKIEADKKEEEAEVAAANAAWEQLSKELFAMSTHVGVERTGDAIRITMEPGDSPETLAAVQNKAITTLTEWGNGYQIITTDGYLFVIESKLRP